MRCRWRFIDLHEGSESRRATANALFLRDGQEVINHQGEVVGALKMTGGSPGHVNPWGLRADVLRVEAFDFGHGGYMTVPPNFPVRVVRPPFPDRMELIIGLPADECLNLRAEPGGPVLTCLPGGTVVSAAQPPPPAHRSEVNSGAPYTFSHGHGWIYVETAPGQQGWVAYGEGNMAWAP